MGVTCSPAISNTYADTPNREYDLNLSASTTPDLTSTFTPILRTHRPIQPPLPRPVQPLRPRNSLARPAQRKCKVIISVNDIDVSMRSEEIQVVQGTTIRDLRHIWLPGFEEAGYFTLSESTLPLDDDYQIRGDIQLNCRINH